MRYLLCIVLMPTILVSAKHIMLLPVLGVSHCLEMKSIGVELINRGHEVTAFIPDFYKFDVCLGGTGIKVFKFPVPKHEAAIVESTFGNISSRVFEDDFSLFGFYNIIKGMQKHICTFYLSAVKDLEAELLKENFDLAVVDSIPVNTCVFGVPHYLKLKYAVSGAVILQYHGNLPSQFNSFPNQFSTYTAPLTFTQRLVNCFVHCAMNFASQYVLSPNHLASVMGPEYAGLDFDELYKNAELYLETSDFIADIPKATFPNFIQTGPLTARPPNALDSELEKFVSTSEGVVYFSFGSVISSFPSEIKQKLFAVFKQLKYKIIFKGNEDKEEGNVKTVKWIQQNNILGHKKTVLFISHCGKNSFFESLYHGVPILCSPLAVDAFATARKVEHFQIGARVDVRSISTNELVDLVVGVLNNNTIKENMKRLSTIIKDRPFTPAQTAANAIEHVLKYGSDHMKSPLRHLSFFSYTGADVWFFLFSIICFTCWLVTKLFLKCFCRKRLPGGEAKPKKKRE